MSEDYSFIIKDRSIKVQPPFVHTFLFERLAGVFYPQLENNEIFNVREFERVIKAKTIQDLYTPRFRKSFELRNAIKEFPKIIEQQYPHSLLQKYEQTVFTDSSTTYCSNNDYARIVGCDGSYFSPLEESGHLAVFDYEGSDGAIVKRFLKIDKVEHDRLSGSTWQGYRTFLNSRVVGDLLRSHRRSPSLILAPYKYTINIEVSKPGRATVTMRVG